MKTHTLNVLHALNIFIIKLRVWMPLGQTRMHFPHNMHFTNEFRTSSIWLFLIDAIKRRKLKLVESDAEQVAAQLPQAMQIDISG